MSGYINSRKEKRYYCQRSGLWKEYKRLINEVRPNMQLSKMWQTFEVQDFVNVLQDLWEIGYNAEWHCIPASAFGRASQTG